MAGAKREELMLMDDRRRIAAMMFEGMNLTDITDTINRGRPQELQVSRQAIQNDIKAIEEQWKKETLFDFNAARNRVLQEIAYLKETYWKEYRKSEQPKITRTTEATVDEEDLESLLQSGEDISNPTRIKKAITREERGTGNPAFLQGIERLIERECRITGIDAPNKMALTNTKGEDVDDARKAVQAALQSLVQVEVEPEDEQ